MTTPTEYPVKRGHVKKSDLSAIVEQCFGAAKKDGEWIESTFGLIARLRVRYEGNDKLIVINEQTKGSTDMEAAQKTIRAWNTFLENATGYNAKQRGKKAQEIVKKAKAGE